MAGNQSYQEQKIYIIPLSICMGHPQSRPRCRGAPSLLSPEYSDYCAGVSWWIVQDILRLFHAKILHFAQFTIFLRFCDGLSPLLVLYSCVFPASWTFGIKSNTSVKPGIPTMFTEDPFIQLFHIYQIQSHREISR